MQDVTKEREKYIGGSDIPIIMGISKFKTRFDLLLEKAQLNEDVFEGNEYTEYGNEMEPKIRDFVSLSGIYKKPFVEDKVIKDDLRYHSDGFNGSAVLEIKTTSQIYDKLEDYKVYLVQLLFGMQMHGVKKGLLAVYERPEDFNTDFDPKRLTTYAVDLDNFEDLLNEINLAVDKFREDLIKVKENPFITEEELQPKELVELSNKVVALENRLKEYKAIEDESKKVRAELKKAMENYRVKTWVTNNGVKITLVEDGKDTEVQVFNEDKFKEDNPELYSNYLETKIKKGRTGSLRITI